jgi:hypothetical protein
MSADGVGLRTVIEFQCAARFNGESVMPEIRPEIPCDPEELRKHAAACHQRLYDLQNFLTNPNCVVLLVGADGKPPGRWERVDYHVE